VTQNILRVDSGGEWGSANWKKIKGLTWSVSYHGGKRENRFQETPKGQGQPTDVVSQKRSTGRETKSETKKIRLNSYYRQKLGDEKRKER